MSDLASKLIERITIQQQTLTPDGYGGQVVNWNDFATVFAQVQPILSVIREHAVAGQLDASGGYRVTVRVRDDLDASMRILWKTHTLTIHSLNENGEILSILTYEENL